MPPQASRPLLIALDTLILLLLVTAAVIADSGGGVVRVAGTRVSLQSAWRPAAWALGLLLLRVAVYRRNGPFGRTWSVLAARLGLIGTPGEAAAAAVPGWGEMLVATAGLTLVIAIVVFEQLRDFYRVPDLGDPLFSMWRMAWVAHQIVNDPWHLFDANIFYPQAGTLTFSDSMLLPALIAAPFVWLGVPIAVTYNVFLLAAFLVSGVAVYLLARGIGLPPGAAWIAALIFALYPYRFEHYSHLELQMAQWMPLTLLAAHRVLATGRFRYALMLMLALAAQWYSSMYYGLFLTIYAGVFVSVLAIAWRAGWRRAGLAAAGLLLGVALALPLARVYRSTERARGSRSIEIVTLYSARPIDYLQPNTRSYWYRDMHVVERQGERELFPHVVPLVLAAVGAVPPITATRLAILVAGLAAFEGSLGFNGHWYPLAYEHLGPLKSVRVPARFAVLVGLTLSLLAGAGVERLLRRLRSAVGKRVLLSVITVAFAVEALPHLYLLPVWKEPPSIYSSLGPRSDAVLFEFPIHAHPHYFGENVPYLYFSTWHWTKMVNGYSGFSSRGYDELALASAGFPMRDTVSYLQKRGVTHVTLHCALWYDEPCALTMERLAGDPRFRLVTSTRWQGKTAQLYELSP